MIPTHIEERGPLTQKMRQTQEEPEPTTTQSRHSAKPEDAAARTRDMPPSQIGIQKLKAELEHARHSPHLSPDDIFTYM